jgi:exodeoxyribonuclease VII large subunit
LLRHRVERATERLERAGLVPALLQRQYDAACKHFAPVARVLPQLDPDKPLARGFARVTDANGHTLTDKAMAEREASLVLKFRDGDLLVAPGTMPPKRSTRAKEPPARQGDLF